MRKNRIWCWLFGGSVRASKGMKPSVSEGGNSVEAKLVKRSEAQQKGEFNIMLDYGNENVLAKKRRSEKTLSTPQVVLICLGIGVVEGVLIAMLSN